MKKQVKASYDYQPTAEIMVPCLKKDDSILNITRTEVQLAYEPVSTGVVF